MKTSLQHIHIEDFITQNGKAYAVPLSYQIFGKPLHTAPVVLVNHALTGNSDVAGENGWWKTLVGKRKPIDTEHFTILAFNVPGNGYDGFFMDNYEDFTASDIAQIFLLGLKKLNIHRLEILIGGSVGGSIAWEMLVKSPDLAQIFVPVATDFKTTDWLYSQCLVQKFLLENTTEPMQKARIHAMLCYRTPESLNHRFKREKINENGLWKSHDWLNYHGRALDQRFDIQAYRLMNHLLMTIDADEKLLPEITADIHLISVDSDLFFPDFEIKKCYEALKPKKPNVHFHQIKSIHGHDAFLMEYEQLAEIFKKIIF